MPASRTKPRRGPTPPRKQAAQADGNPRLQRAAQLGYVATVAAGCFLGILLVLALEALW